MNATRRPGCKAQQHSDQMCCGQCGLAWDMSDPDPPECKGSPIHAGYVDTATMRVAFPIKYLFEHDLTADMTMYRYNGSAGMCGLDPWTTVDGLDQSTRDPSVFYIDLVGTAKNLTVTCDDFLFLSAKDAAKVKLHDRISVESIRAQVAKSAAVAPAIRKLLTCGDAELKASRDYLKSLFNK